MIRVALPDLPVIGPLIQQRIDGANLSHRLSVDNALSKLHGMLEANQGAIFVDDLLLPTAVLVLHTGVSLVFDEKFCNILLIFVDQAHRSVQKALTCIKTVEDYARAEGCTSIYGSSWIYRGAEGIDSLYKHAGFEPQDTTFVKHLT